MTDQPTIRFTRGPVTFPVACAPLPKILGQIVDPRIRTAIERRLAGRGEEPVVELDPEQFRALLDATSAWGLETALS